MIPLIIEELIKDLEMVEITDFHRSGDLVYSIGNKYILKISEELTRLQQEFEKIIDLNFTKTYPDDILCTFVCTPS